jgi:hypothetical protein
MAKVATKNNDQKHSVDVALKVSDIAKAGAALTLRVHARGALLATIEIGQGTLGYKAASKQRFKRVSWSALGELLDK